MSEEERKTVLVPKNDDNPFCHSGMTCVKGCSCAGKDGKCPCKMISARRCTCNGFCGVRMTK